MSENNSSLVFLALPFKALEGAFARQNKKIHKDPYILFGPEKCYLPASFTQHWPRYDEVEVRDDDVWLCSFPKCGSTWVFEMAWLILNNLDIERAKKSIYDRAPYLEINAGMNMEKQVLGFDPVDQLKITPSPRMVRTNLPFSLLPAEIRNGVRKPKLICVTRNPKDVCVSYFHHAVLVLGYLGTMDDFVDDFCNNFVTYGPYFEHVNSYYSHIIEGEGNILFLTYEDMQDDLLDVIERTAAFLGKTLSLEQKQFLIRHLNFENMKGNKSVNRDEQTEKFIQIHGVPRKTRFMRKGKVGSWKTELSFTAIDKLEEWIASNSSKHGEMIKQLFGEESAVLKVDENNNKA